eukprot:Nk52_evm31s2462 gene=Nk52_evmTU31s2462
MPAIPVNPDDYVDVMTVNDPKVPDGQIMLIAFGAYIVFILLMLFLRKFMKNNNVPCPLPLWCLNCTTPDCRAQTAASLVARGKSAVGMPTVARGDAAMVVARDAATMYGAVEMAPAAKLVATVARVVETGAPNHCLDAVRAVEESNGIAIATAQSVRPSIASAASSGSSNCICIQIYVYISSHRLLYFI